MHARRKRWLELWRRLGATCEMGSWYAPILAYYVGRAYHNIGHIDQGLTEFDGTRHLALDPDSVELAWFGHDVIYVPGRSDNEERSAKIVAWIIAQAGLLPQRADNLVERTNGLIAVATKHNTVLVDPDQQLMADIDLSTMGYDDARFDDVGRRVREEYRHVPQDVFNLGRSSILESFLKRPFIYYTYTEHFRNKYEAKAQRNLKRALAKLSNPPRL